MKNIIILLFVSIVFSCKESKNNSLNNIAVKEEILDTVSKHVNQNLIKDTLFTNFDFKNKLKTVIGVKHTKEKHKDWMTNSIGFTDKLVNLNRDNIIIKSTSYEYKNDCYFYLHTIKHTDKDSTIKPFLESAQGKRTEGYTRERVLILAMKNDKEANFIDMPPNWNAIELKEKFLDVLYEKIEGDVIICHRANECEYKSLPKSNN